METAADITSNNTSSDNTAGGTADSTVPTKDERSHNNTSGDNTAGGTADSAVPPKDERINDGTRRDNNKETAILGNTESKFFVFKF